MGYELLVLKKEWNAMECYRDNYNKYALRHSKLFLYPNVALGQKGLPSPELLWSPRARGSKPWVLHYGTLNKCTSGKMGHKELVKLRG